jgi:hypothetical protein
MQLRSEIQLLSMIKAMREVIIPAVDPANRLALEQAQLVTGMLGLMQHQLPLQFRFDRDELCRLIGLLRSLSDVQTSDAAFTLWRERHGVLLAESQAVFEGCAVDPEKLHNAVRRLREVIGELASLTGHTSEPVRNLVEQEILRVSGEQLLRDRALVAPQGWEPDPRALPSIHALLAADAQDAGAPQGPASTAIR